MNVKGYIEVHSKYSRKAMLVNVSSIEFVQDSRIYTGHVDLENGEGEDYFSCIETYDQIVDMIREAMR